MPEPAVQEQVGGRLPEPETGQHRLRPETEQVNEKAAQRREDGAGQKNTNIDHDQQLDHRRDRAGSEADIGWRGGVSAHGDW